MPGIIVVYVFAAAPFLLFLPKLAIAPFMFSFIVSYIIYVPLDSVLQLYIVDSNIYFNDPQNLIIFIWVVIRLVTVDLSFYLLRHFFLDYSWKLIFLTY